jgi:hypothetical protein
LRALSKGTDRPELKTPRRIRFRSPPEKSSTASTFDSHPSAERLVSHRWGNGRDARAGALNDDWLYLILCCQLSSASPVPWLALLSS